ncbi:MAG: hypothetical protein ACLP6E_18145 [Acidimicrobiales bacterium]
MRRLVIVAVLGLIPLLAACGGPSAGALGGKSAEQVLTLAQQAATKKGSFHFIDETGSGSSAQVLSGDISDVTAQEETKGPDGLLEVRLVDGTIYVNATASTLVYSLKLSSSIAAAHAGDWISLERTDAPYQTVAKALGPTAELGAYIPVGDLKIGSATTLRGQDVLPVSGTAPAFVGANLIATLYVSTTAPFVPVGGTLSGTGAHKNEAEVVAFTAWGERIHAIVPPDAVAYSSLGSA